MLLPQTTTIRIDPYLPGVTQISDFENIIKQAHSFGIKKFVTSTM
jgi:DNA repair photolyase